MLQGVDFVQMKIILLGRKPLLLLLLLLLLSSHAYSQMPESPIVCGTPALDETPVVPCSRYTYATQEESLSTGHFKIHYTLLGSDATTLAYATEIAVYAESSYVVECLQMGFTPPPTDGVCGGDSLWDIYIRAITAAGFTERDDSVAGENRWISHVSIRSNLTDANARREVVAHEFHHMIQFGYSKNDFLGTGNWFAENTAQWVVPLVFPSAKQKVINRINSGPGPFWTPWWSITSNNTGDFVSYEYGGALWPIFLSEWLNDSEVMKRFYDRFRETTVRATYSDIQYVLSTYYEKTLDRAFEQYAIWRNFTGSCFDSTTFGCVGSRKDDFHFSDAQKLGYLATSSAGTYPFSYDSVAGGSGGCSITSLKDGSENLRVTFHGDSVGSWSAFVLGIKTPQQSQVYRIPLDEKDSGWISIPWSFADSFVVVPVRIDTLTTTLSYRIAADNDSTGPGNVLFPIVASAGSHGTINPSGTVNASYGTNAVFTLMPDSGYHVDSLVVDGKNIDSLFSYTFPYVVTEHTIRVAFSNQYTITAATSGSGTITPSGDLSVLFGDSVRFTFVADTGASLDSVIVDGSRVDSTEGYTFTTVTNNHSIAAYFSPDSFTITATAGLHGIIAPSGMVRVSKASNQSFSMDPDSGYVVGNLTIDGIPVTPATAHGFSNIGANHTINATFTPPSIEVSVTNGWNLVSLSLTVNDSRKNILFPSSVSNAYAFIGSGGYIRQDTIRNGIGYWLKFANTQDIQITGFLRTSDTVDVANGWNLIGSTSYAMSVSDVQQIPPGILQSPFYGHDGTYAVADSLLPSRGYWVKSGSLGKLVLTISGQK